MRFKAKKTKMRASKTEGSSDSESEQTVSNDPPSQPPGLMPGAFNLFGSGIPPQTGASPQPNTSNTMQNLLFDPSEIYKSIGLANKTAQEMEQAKKLQESRFNNQCGNTWNYRIGNAIPSVTSDTEESTVDTDAASIMTPNLDFRRQSRRRKGFIFPTNPFHESLDMSEHKSRSSNHLRPTSDPTVIYKEKIDNDKTVNDLITVCEMFRKAFVDNQSMSETDKKAMTSYLSQINNLKVRKMVEIQEREKIYENSQRLKTIRKEQVIVPENCPDYPSSLPFNEIHNFSKFEVTGPDAEQWIDTIMAGRMPKQGRLTLSPMLSPKGKQNNFILRPGATCYPNRIGSAKLFYRRESGWSFREQRAIVYAKR